jgi:hypothetical protein
LAFAAPLAVYGLVRLVDHTFSVRDHPGFFGLTIFGSLRDLPQSGGKIGLHVARILVGIAGAAAVLVGALAARRWSRADPLPFAFWAGLAGGVAVSGEAFLLNPAWIKGSEPLLSALGAALFVVAAAAALGALDRNRPLRRWPALVALAGLVGTSLHHRFSAISPVSTPGQYAALAAVSAAAIACAVALGARRGGTNAAALTRN